MTHLSARVRGRSPRSAIVSLLLYGSFTLTAVDSLPIFSATLQTQRAITLERRVESCSIGPHPSHQIYICPQRAPPTQRLNGGTDTSFPIASPACSLTSCHLLCVPSALSSSYPSAGASASSLLEAEQSSIAVEQEKKRIADLLASMKKGMEEAGADTTRAEKEERGDSSAPHVIKMKLRSTRADEQQQEQEIVPLPLQFDSDDEDASFSSGLHSPSRGTLRSSSLRIDTIEETNAPPDVSALAQRLRGRLSGVAR